MIIAYKNNFLNGKKYPRFKTNRGYFYGGYDEIGWFK